MVKHCETLRRTVHVVNLDPAAEHFDYPVLVGKGQKNYIKTCVNRHSQKDQKLVFKLLLNAGQKYCRGAFSIFLTFIKLRFVIKIFALSIFELPFYTGFTVYMGRGFPLPFENGVN